MTWKMGFSALPLPEGQKVKACTMFAGRLFAATESNGVFALDENGVWERIIAMPLGAAADLKGIRAEPKP